MATEIQMAKIAVDRGASADVREFARRALIENSKARRDLAQIICRLWRSDNCVLAAVAQR